MISLDARARCEWSYLSGRLHLSAGEATEAAAAFERAASPGDGGEPCALASYARLRQATALVRAGRYDEAVAAAQSVGDEIAAHDETKLTLADALSCQGDRAAALAIWRAFLAANPRGLRWVDLSLQIATALLDGVDGPPAAGAQEALDRTTRVVVEAPLTAEKLDAATVRQRAATVAKTPLRTFTPEERARLAQAWLDASQPKKAREAADQALAAIPRGEHDAARRQAACSAAIVRAQATPRGKSDDPAGAWGTAIGRCEKEDALVTALYYGARASANARRDAEALDRFGRVEKLFPKHRLADDARFRSALVVEDQGDATARPRDARVDPRRVSARATWASRRSSGSRSRSSRATTSTRRGRRSIARSSSRPRAQGPGARQYFRARVAELGAAIRRTPSGATRRSWRVHRSTTTCCSRTRVCARWTTRSRDRPSRPPWCASPAGPLVTQDHAELASPAFERFVSLLEVGEVDAARREASAGGLTAGGRRPRGPLDDRVALRPRRRAGARPFVRARPARRLSRALARRALEAGVGGRVSSRIRRRRHARERLDADSRRAHVGHHARRVRVQPRSQERRERDRPHAAHGGDGPARRARRGPPLRRAGAASARMSRSRSARACSPRSARRSRATPPSRSPHTTAARTRCAGGCSNTERTTSTCSSSTSRSTRRATTSSTSWRARRPTRTSTRPRHSTRSSRCPPTSSPRRRSPRRRRSPITQALQDVLRLAWSRTGGYGRGPVSRPASSIDVARRRAMTTWSSRGVPTTAAARSTVRVNATSSWLGAGSPLG